MKTTERHNGRASYISIETATQSWDVLLEPGKTPAESLLSTAADWRKQAERLTRNAAVIEAIAADMRQRAAA